MNIHLKSYMITCPQRENVRGDTIQSIAESDLPMPSLIIDQGTGIPIESMTANWKRAIDAFIADVLQEPVSGFDSFGLFLEDDLLVNRNIAALLRKWLVTRDGSPLPFVKTGQPFIGSLYRPAGQFDIAEMLPNAWVAATNSVWGSQAYVMNLRMAAQLSAAWDLPSPHTAPDFRIMSIAARLQMPKILIHRPSLVQHMPAKSTWGAGFFHQASDFDAGYGSGL